jgi:hypothetical protein
MSFKTALSLTVFVLKSIVIFALALVAIWTFTTQFQAEYSLFQTLLTTLCVFATIAIPACFVLLYATRNNRDDRRAQ